MGKSETKKKTLAVNKLMPESLQNYRFCGTTLPYEELLIALEKNIMDKVTTHPLFKVKKFDTSAPMETAGTDGQETFEEGYGKI